MNRKVSEINLQRMLSLIRAALHGINSDEDLFSNLTDSDWNEIFDLSTAQGVLVLSLNGITLLNKKLQPPITLKMRWIASAETVEKNYKHKLATAKALSLRYRENNIRMMVFKGVSISRLYPVPSSREFGDIDIFLFGKSKEGDTILNKVSRNKFNISKKHICHVYKGVLIENHHTILSHGFMGKLKHSEYLEEQLMMILKEAGYMNDAHLDETTPTDDQLIFPPPDFDSLFVTLHTLIHFSERIVLRQLCDITLIFTALKGKINFSLYKDSLSKAGFEKLADAFISISVRYLGLDPECAPPYKSDFELEDRVWNDLMIPKILSPSKEKSNFFNVFIFNIKLMIIRRWKTEIIFPGQFIKRLFYFTFYFIVHPNKMER